MIFQFTKNDVTFNEEDEAYFEKRLKKLDKYLGSEADKDEDSIKINITIKKNKHHTGKRFECTLNMSTTHNGTFHIETTEENIKKCADTFHDELQRRLSKSHEKHKK